MWRAIRRMTIGAVILAALLAAALQGVFWSDLPRRLAVDTLGRETGLRVEISGLSTGWSGRTQIEGLALALPGDQTPLLSATSIDLRHSCIASIIIGVFTLESVVVDEIAIDMRENDSGEWNLQRLAALIGDRKKDAAPPAITAPSLSIRKLSLTVADANERRIDIDDMQVTAEPIGPSALRFDASAAALGKVSGELIMQGQWQHELQIEAPNVHTLAAPWLGQSPEPIAADAHWSGRVAGGELRGRLTIKNGTYGSYSGQGSIQVSATTAQLTVVPKQVRIETPLPQLHRFTLVNGRARLDRQQVRVDTLHVQTPDAQLGLKGHFDFLTQAGDVEAEWTQQMTDPLPAHDGTLKAKLTTSALGERQLDATVTTHGRAADLRWTTVAEINASGPSWRQFNWRFSADSGELAFAGQKRHEVSAYWPLSGLSARGQVNWPRLTVRQLQQSHNGDIRASGWLDFHSQHFHAAIEADAFSYEQIPIGTIDLRADVSGRRDQIELRSAAVRGKGFDVAVSGAIHRSQHSSWTADLVTRGRVWSPGVAAPLMPEDFAAPHTQSHLSPVFGAVTNDGDKPNAADAPIRDEAVEAKAQAASTNESPAWAGRAAFEGRINGRIDPPNLQAGGKLVADAIMANGRPVDPVVFDLQITANSRQITARSSHLAMLGGGVDVQVAYAPRGKSIDLKAKLENVDLQKVARLINPDLNLSGEVGAELSANLPIDQPQNIDITGAWQASRVVYDQFEFDHAGGQMQTIRPGDIRFEPVEFRLGDGKADGGMIVSIADGVQSRLQLTLDHWPVDLAEYQIAAIVNGSGSAHADLIAGSVTGDFDMIADVRVSEHPLGPMNLSGSWNNQQLTVELKESALLGGRINGHAVVLPADLWHSRGMITMRGVDPQKLAPWFAHARHFDGPLQGEIQIRPAEDPRAPEPLMITADLRAMDSQPIRYRQAPWGPVQATAYLGAKRLLLDDSTVHLADGTANVWLSLHKHDDQWRDHLRVGFKNLKVEELARSFRDRTESLPGRLSGRANAYGRLGDWAAHDGEGRIQLTESNLQNTDILGSVLSLMGVRTDQPTGAGFADFRLEQGALTIDRFVYHNRATEILVRGEIENLAKGVQSGIDGYAIGSLRPFRETEAMGLGDFGRMVRAFQSQATTVKISGTIAEPSVQQATLVNLAEELKHLFRSPDN